MSAVWQGFSANGEWLATCQAGVVVQLWEPSKWTLSSCVELCEKLRHATWHPSQTMLLILNLSGTILWRPQVRLAPCSELWQRLAALRRSGLHGRSAIPAAELMLIFCNDTGYWAG